MKRIICLMIIVIVVMCGCQNDKNIITENRFIENQDNQYMYSDVWYGTTLQHSSDGYYFLKDNFLYFIDEKDMSVYPLCNKADCLHDRETDDRKKQGCNAYITGDYLPAEQKIQYYNNSIYYIDNTKIETEGLILKRIDIDTQRTESVYTVKTMFIDDWIIHRGYFYYAQSVITTQDSDGKEKVETDSAVYGVDLEDNSSSRCISDFDKMGLDLQKTENLQAYGNYVYFDCSTVEKGTDILDSDNSSFQDKRYVYDIEKNKCYCLADKVKGDSPTFCGYYNDKIICLSGGNCIYTCDLNGENTKKLFDYDKRYYGYNIFTDGRYIYFEEMEKEQGIYYVFDGKGKVLNRVKMPFIIDPQLPYDENFIVRFIEDNSTLQIVSKKDIATKKKLTSKIIYDFS